MFSISQLSVALLLPVCSLATPLPTASAPASTIEVAPTFTCHCDGSDPKIWSGKYKPTRLSMQGTTAHEILLADPNNLPALRHECIEQCYFIAGCNMARLDPTDPRVCEAYFFEVSTISSTESWTPSELPNGLGAWFLVPPGYPLCSDYNLPGTCDTSPSGQPSINTAVNTAKLSTWSQSQVQSTTST